MFRVGDGNFFPLMYVFIYLFLICNIVDILLAIVFDSTRGIIQTMGRKFKRMTKAWK